MNPTCKTIKVRLKNILNDDIVYKHFFNCINTANNLIFIASNFIRAYVLHKFKTAQHIPEINYNFIRMAFKAISKKSRGPKPKGCQLIIYNDLCLYYSNHFAKLMFDNTANIENCKFNSTNLSYIFNLAAKEMETNYTNNIKLNFFKYLNQYVNQSFIECELQRLTAAEYNKLSFDDKKKYNIKRSKEFERVKILKKELKVVKTDLADGTLKSDEKYHDWIEEQRSIILPKLTKKVKSYDDDIDLFPFKYLKYMLVMNKVLERNGKKLFQPICLRTGVTDKYITLDTSAIKEIFTQQHSGKTNDEVWTEYFDIDEEKYKLKNYTFNHQISTDGLSASINFIRKDKIESKNIKIKAKAEASRNSKSYRKNKTEAEIKEIKKQQEIAKNQKAILQKQLAKDRIKKQSEDYKKLSKEEQDLIKLKQKLAKNKYEYIEDAVKDSFLLKRLQDANANNRIKVIDPGSRSPMTIYGMGQQIKKHLCKERKEKKEKTGPSKLLYNYTNKMRVTALKRIKYIRAIDNKKKKLLLNKKTIKERETELSNYSSKTVNEKKFLKYVKLKLELRKLVFKNKKYNEYIKQLRWYGYINKKRHEDKLLHELGKIYGNDAIFVIGDWGNKGRLKYMSTPNMGMKKLLASKFEVYLIDEYKTSQLFHKNETKGEKLKLAVKYKRKSATDNTGEDRKIREIHSVLTFKMSNKESECINRDYNAVLNMEKITNHLLEFKTRPANFIRTCQPAVKPVGQVMGSS